MQAAQPRAGARSAPRRGAREAVPLSRLCTTVSCSQPRTRQRSGKGGRKGMFGCSLGCSGVRDTSTWTSPTVPVSLLSCAFCHFAVLQVRWELCGASICRRHCCRRRGRWHLARTGRTRRRRGACGAARRRVELRRSSRRSKKASSSSMTTCAHSHLSPPTPRRRLAAHPSPASLSPVNACVAGCVGRTPAPRPVSGRQTTQRPPPSAGE